MTDSSKMSGKTEYDEIVRKLDALLSRHKRATPAESGTPAPAYPASFTGNVEAPLTANDNIPTLTETVQVVPSMLSPHADVRSLLWQILDSALKDTGADLDAATRHTLVKALESRLFGL
jgi:hypothetical protein